MIKGNNKFRINHVPSKTVLATKQEPATFTSIFNKVIQAVKEKAANAYSKFESKLTDTPAVFTVGKDQRQKQLSVQIIQRDRESSMSKNSENLKGRAKSNLTNQDGQRLKQLMSRKQQLMQKLRKIDYQLLNPPQTLDLGLSRASAQSPFKQLQSRIKVQQSRVYNPNQHQKTIEMLSRLNNEKIKRQQRIVQDMKRKQEQQIKKLNDIENNKSNLILNRRRNPTPLAKFNTKQIENPAFDRKTNSVAESNHKLSQKVYNEFDQLPELITSQKPYIEQQPIQEQNV